MIEGRSFLHLTAILGTFFLAIVAMDLFGDLAGEAIVVLSVGPVTLLLFGSSLSAEASSAAGTAHAPREKKAATPSSIAVPDLALREEGNCFTFKNC